MQKQTGGSGGLRCALTALLGLLGLGALVLLGGAAWALTHLPDPAAEMPAAFNPAQVMVIQPANGQSVVLGQALSVYGRAFGNQPVQDVELYVDGKRLGGQAAEFPAGATKVTAAWVWTPRETGAHVLTARVRTQGGGGNVSNPVTVNALAAEAFPPFPEVAGIEEVGTLTEDELAALEEEGTPMDPAAGGGGSGEAPEPEEPEQIQPPGQQPGGGFLPIGIMWWIGQKLGWMVPASAPEAPQLDGLAQDCNGMLVVKDNADNEAGFFLYRLDPGKFVFERIATLDAKQGAQVFSYADAGLASGTYFYYLAAFNLKGETPSNVVSLQVAGPVCDAALPPIFEPESIPVDAAQPTDRAYCYGSADGMPWVRLPAGQSNFMEPVNGKYDLAPYWDQIPLPKPLPPKFLLNMECWGWSGDTLVYLGASSKEFIAEKEAKKPQQGEAEPSPVPDEEPDGKGGGGELAAPYNLHFMNDIVECEQHNLSNNPANEEQCEDLMGANASVLNPEKFKPVLAWDWSQYGDCDPESEPCYMNYLMPEGFVVYRQRYQGSKEMIVGLPTNITFTPLLFSDETVQPKDEYYVTSAIFNPEYIQSMDSNHVQVGDAHPIPILPNIDEVLLVKRIVIQKIVNGVVQTQPISDKWFYTKLTPNEDSYAGYSRIEKNQLLKTFYYYSMLRFALPKNQFVHNANIMWIWSDMKAEGNGIGALNSACGVYLSTHNNGASILPGYAWKDMKQYDVTGPVKQALMMDWASVEIWFTHNTNFSSTSHPNVCLIQLDTPIMGMSVSDLK